MQQHCALARPFPLGKVRPGLLDRIAGGTCMPQAARERTCNRVATLHYSSPGRARLLGPCSPRRPWWLQCMAGHALEPPCMAGHVKHFKVLAGFVAWPSSAAALSITPNGDRNPRNPLDPCMYTVRITHHLACRATLMHVLSPACQHAHGVRACACIRPVGQPQQCLCAEAWQVSGLMLRYVMLRYMASSLG